MDYVADPEHSYCRGNVASDIRIPKDHRNRIVRDGVYEFGPLFVLGETTSVAGLFRLPGTPWYDGHLDAFLEEIVKPIFVV